ncbi:MAG: hypothetical protein ACFFBD_27740 [Candidatus Hodarchaeota archaeon]
MGFLFKVLGIRLAVLVVIPVAVFIIGLWVSLTLPAGLPPGNVLFPSPVGMVQTGSTLLGALVNGLVYGAIAFGVTWVAIKLSIPPDDIKTRK